MLRLSRPVHAAVLAESWRVHPEEACGVLIGRPGDVVRRFRPVDNATRSGRVFQLDGAGHLAAEREAEEAGLEIVGVVHSHTHTAAYPSATDLEQAANPFLPATWHWVIVSLGWGLPEIRSFARSPLGDHFGEDSASGIAEEPVVLSD